MFDRKEIEQHQHFTNKINAHIANVLKILKRYYSIVEPEHNANKIAEYNKKNHSHFWYVCSNNVYICDGKVTVMVALDDFCMNLSEYEAKINRKLQDNVEKDSIFKIKIIFKSGPPGEAYYGGYTSYRDTYAWEDTFSVNCTTEQSASLIGYKSLRKISEMICKKLDGEFELEYYKVTTIKSDVKFT